MTRTHVAMPTTAHISYILQSYTFRKESHYEGNVARKRVWLASGWRSSFLQRARRLRRARRKRCHVRSHATPLLLQTTMCDAWISSGGDNWRTGIWAPSSQFLAKCIREKIWITIRIKLFRKSADANINYYSLIDYFQIQIKCNSQFKK
jgi:hypothetical protein